MGNFRSVCGLSPATNVKLLVTSFCFVYIVPISRRLAVSFLLSDLTLLCRCLAEVRFVARLSSTAWREAGVDDVHFEGVILGRSRPGLRLLGWLLGMYEGDSLGDGTDIGDIGVSMVTE